MSFLRYLAAPYSSRTAGELGFLLLGLPMGVVWFVYAITMYAVSLSLLIVWVGFAVFVATQVSMRWIGAVERAQVNGLLGVRIPPPDARPRSDARVSAGARAARYTLELAHDAAAWRVLAWVSVRIVTGPVGFAIALVAVVLPLSLVVAFGLVVGYEVGWIDVSTEATAEAALDEGGWRWGYAALPLALLIAPALTLAARAFASLHRSLARWALGPRVSAAAREATARAERAEAQVRIDQELHDSIGHMITMNVVQAGAGAHVFDSDPEFARRALQNIEERGRAAMGELDRIIATIRGDDAPLAPLPSVEQIEELAGASRRAGATVTCRVDADGIAGALGRTAYAVVREALTNAARHAPGAPVDVLVARDGDALGIAVVNGPAAGAPAPRDRAAGGRGLAGIRDRVGLMGGVAALGPEDGGFAVRALLPLGTEIGAGEPGSPWAGLRAKVAP
ncbi:sensor histidine kinase [Demequina lignilytica]|uniref:histidine kinase n=1 Tax=Demequina lignilytica TaxID=3051663 RepID=A0AB35MG40_9MICO|nr:sensor histidine kinase [Demequina sp. SYSU T0a273]MDN4482732.1 sensor domain-containing protein [Demequina sp. SYSU T0a273]